MKSGRILTRSHSIQLHLASYSLSFLQFDIRRLVGILFFTFGLSTFAFAQQYGWKDISANVPGNPSLSDVFFVSDNEGWITSSSYAEIYHTTNGGATFEVRTTQYTCNAIHMLNANEGYAGGASGFIYKTTDGGEHWNFFGTMVATLADISFPPVGDTGYCCGINGNIYKITTNPDAVTKMTSNVNGHLNSISFPVTSDEGWVCGGDVIRHFSGGTWTGDQDYPSGGYNAIYFIDNNNGWAVGDSGVIAHTTDGQNWSAQTNPSSNTLYDVFFLNTQEGWAVGLGGTIIHTTNGGTTWVVEGTGLTSNSLNGVHFTSPTNGYVVGNGKTLLKFGDTLPPAPRAQVDKFNIYFGEVAIGSHKDEVLTLSNTGTADLIVGQVAQANPVELPFSIAEDNCTGETLVPAGTCTITTRFSPTTDNEYSDTFDIPTNATPSTLTISLHSGIKPFPWPMFIPASTIKE